MPPLENNPADAHGVYSGESKSERIDRSFEIQGL